MYCAVLALIHCKDLNKIVTYVRRHFTMSYQNKNSCKCQINRVDRDSHHSNLKSPTGGANGTYGNIASHGSTQTSSGPSSLSSCSLRRLRNDPNIAACKGEPVIQQPSHLNPRTYRKGKEHYHSDKCKRRYRTDGSREPGNASPLCFHKPETYTCREDASYHEKQKRKGKEERQREQKFL